MRRSRWLFLAAILCIVVSVGATYVKRKEILARAAPPRPAPLETGVEGRANDWVYTQSDGGRPRVTIRAKSFRQVTAPSVMELNGVELQLFNRDGTEFDLVRSAEARFNINGKALYSEGKVDIEMGMQTDGSPRAHLLNIHSSGVRFESDTGKASTDRTATFEFDQGGGSAAGADYDPNTRELHLRSQVALDWRGKTADTVPMHIEGGEAYYRERESKVVLLPWSKLTRGTLHMEAGMTVVALDDGEIREADTQMAHGVQDDPGRKVEFGAEQMVLHFAGGMLVNKIDGERNTKLISTANATRTTVTAERLDLGFDIAAKESTLTTAVATGKGVAEAEPVPAPGVQPAETRVLHSDTIRMKMRPGGKEIATVETDGAGTLDFLPNRPDQPKRWMKGDRIWITYGEDNRIQSFRSVNVSTRTDKPAPRGQPPLSPALTSSKDILATFDPKSSELARLEQKIDFRYEEGVRHARSDRATLEQQKDLMTLDGSARVWDPTGSAAGDHIVMNQKSGDFTVQGHVASTRMPDPKGGSSAMLSNDEIMQARAQLMVSTENSQKIHYEGNAVAWQGANRVEADRLDIDRDKQSFEAHGKVISQFVDKSKTDEKSKSGVKSQDPGKSPNAKPQDSRAQPAAKSAAAVFTVVHAPDLVYTDDVRIAHYTGGVVLNRPGLNVAGKEIRAFLKPADQDSSLDKAIADGAVKILSTTELRTRTGTSEHAEYYAGEEKVILQGGEPLLVDSLKGRTKGKELTWFANNDRLLVDGVESLPSDSVLRKK